ncbi:hypothetical protein BG006_002281 [Podila minutissima]|uniref:Uncharacterized protein n=1 Tax=Podila minutissima TaxID=64525 RepID=A0A9P5SSZ2_9FUNG|nr:hypothetical protein BG006_002281 [Podila minutissima]
MYIEQVATNGVTPDDHLFLNHLCPPITPEELGQVNTSNQDKQDAVNMDDDSEQVTAQWQFIACFMQYLYSNKYPTTRGVGSTVNDFITCLMMMGLHAPMKERDALWEKSEFSPVTLIQSVTSQLAVEMKMMYCNGSNDLLEQLKAQREQDKKQDTGKDSGAGTNTSTGLQPKVHMNVSAIENFLELNKLTGSCHRIILMSPQESSFVSFSERELLVLFMSRPVLKARILSWLKDDYSDTPAVDDLDDWLSCKEPGYLIKKLLANLTLKHLTVHQQGKAGYKGTIKLNSINEIRNHLHPLWKKTTFDPHQYNQKGLWIYLD